METSSYAGPLAARIAERQEAMLAIGRDPHESVRIADVVRDTLTHALLAIRLLPEPTR